MGPGIYYVIFFDEDFNIKQAHKAKSYPTIKDVVYLLKSFEKSETSDTTDINNLMMDIITEEEFKSISSTFE